MSKIPLIGFTGKAGVGKDTAAAHVREHYGFKHYAFAWPIKAMLEAMGLPEKDYLDRASKEAVIPAYGVSYRVLAQTLGTEWGRARHPDFWLITAQLHHAAAEAAGYPGIVISDVRFENEAAWIRSVGGVVVHIEGRATTLEGTTAQHASEAGIAYVPGDLRVWNDSTIQDLYDDVGDIVAGECA